MKGLDALQETLGFVFKDEDLLRQALTHRSYLNENPADTLSSNERLEYLGDAMLSLAVAWELYNRFPQFPEGKLTKLRAALVCQDGLAHLARRMKLGQYLYLGKGEEKGGGRKKPRTLASALEALIGAALIDQGFEAAREFVLKLLEEELEHIDEKELEDPRSKLQELVQAELKLSPTYHLSEVSGVEHHRRFIVEALAGDILLGQGQGRSKREAKKEAAKSALENWPKWLEDFQRREDVAEKSRS